MVDPTARRAGDQLKRAGGRDIASRRLIWLLVLAAVAAVLALALGTRNRQEGLPVEQLVRSAVAAAEQGDHQASLQYLDQVLSVQPDHPEALLYRGQMSYERDEPREAREFLRRVPNSPGRLGSMARYIEGVSLVAEGYARDGEQLLRQAVALNASFLPPHERLLELYAAEMRTADMRHELEQIRRLRPWRLEELALYTTAGESPLSAEEGIAQMRRFLQAVPGNVQHQLLLAQYQLEGEQHDEAEKTLSDVLAHEPDSARALGLLAERHIAQEALDAAALTLGRVRPQAEPDFWFYRSCGRLWLKQGQEKLAAECLGEAARLDPEDLMVAHQLGTALSRLRAEDAAEHLKRAELMDHVIRQTSRIPQRDYHQRGPLLEILVDVGNTLAQLERDREAAFWFAQALLLDSHMAPARAGLQAATEKMREAEDPTRARVVDQRSAVAGSAAWPSIVEHIRTQAMDLQGRRKVAAEGGQSGTIRLRDIGRAAGIDFQYFNGHTGSKYLLESMGGGVAVLDYDCDGWSDLYLVQGCKLPYDAQDGTHRNRLYRNLGNGHFEDVTAAAGVGDNRYGQGCAASDYDNDGDTDLFVANWGENVLYRNNGDGTFSDVTEAAGLDGEQWSSSVGFADLDKDGAPDLYITNYVEYADSLRICRGVNGRLAACDPGNFAADQDRLYRNLGDGTFEDVTETSGVVAANGKGLGLVLADLDNDSWTDIYVANDGTPNFLFHNNSEPGKIILREMGVLSGVAISGNGQAEGGMGIACADFQNDGRLDLYVTNFAGETNTFYANLGELLFEDASSRTQVSAGTKPLVGFGVQPIDFDLDGLADLLVANGHIDDFRFRDEPWKMRPQLFRNRGRGRFEELGSELGPYFAGEYLGRGVARLDWDRDGDHDAVVVHQDAPLALLNNETPRASNWLGVELCGVTSCRDAIGARIQVHTGAGILYLENSAGDGFYSSNERRQIIGLGPAESVKEVVVYWPSGRVETLPAPAVNQMHLIIEGRAVPQRSSAPPAEHVNSYSSGQLREIDYAAPERFQSPDLEDIR